MMKKIGVAPKVMDYAVNRLFGNYIGFKPRSPNRLIIPRFVIIRAQSGPIMSELAHQLPVKIFRRTAIVADENTRRIAGDRVYRELKDMGFDPTLILVNSNRVDEVIRVAKTLTYSPGLWSEKARVLDRRLYALKRVSMILGIGGGTVIDMAKLAAKYLHLPYISMPTTLANDGIASPFSVLNPGFVSDSDVQETIKANTPMGVIVDLSNIKYGFDLDPVFFRNMIMSGVGDITSNITAVLDWRLAAEMGKDKIDVMALFQAKSGAEVVLNLICAGCPVHSDDFLMTLAMALASSGEAMARVGSSRPASGFEHKFFHAFSKRNVSGIQISHGTLVAVGTLISARAHEFDVMTLRRAYAAVGLPTTKDELGAQGITMDQVHEAIRKAPRIKPERYTILEHRGVDALVKSAEDVFP